jgi:hypothetical protein
MPDVSGLPALDVAIGLTFVFAVLSLIASGINEWIVRRMDLRAKTLENGIRNLLDDPDSKGLAKQVLDHPLIATLKQHGAESDPTPTKPASYIPAQAFAAALFDTIAPPESGKDRDLVKAARKNIDTIPSPAVQKALRALADDTRDDIDGFRKAVEGWYDATMDRVSGWYKRHIQKFLLWIGIVLALTFNVDAFQIGNTLWNDDALRAAVVAQAEKVAKDQPSSDDPAEQVKQSLKVAQETRALKLPIGWSNTAGDPRDVPNVSVDSFGDAVRSARGVLGKLLGILISGFAVSLGAPFWFDLMGKALSLRSSGKPPQPAAGS